MIFRYNLTQTALAPLHLLLAAFGFYFSWRFVETLIDEYVTNLLPAQFYQHGEVITWSVAAIAIGIAFVLAFRMWLHEQTALPGILSAVPSFGSPTRRSSSGEFALIEYSVYFRIIGNLFLLGPLQLLFCIQRFRNLIPNSSDLENRLKKWLDLARDQKRWHPTGLYAGDYDSLDYLIRMGKLDYSPTKEVVKERKF